MTGLVLEHYSAVPLVLDRHRSYRQKKPRSFGKPEGLWVSVAGEDDWPSWCRSDASFVGSLACAHRVTLNPGNDIHVITSTLGLDAFTDEYAVETDWTRRHNWRRRSPSWWPIDWSAVTQDCGGLIIAPYLWSRRLNVEWYYVWDCASGCIWNLDAIASVEPVAAEVLS